ncbi:MAG: PDZ domain-containing protein, partial [Ignavibacteriae bacterium]|nr:PDZ domain-containing protein [Ignavibacteriota bacterium]
MPNDPLDKENQSSSKQLEDLLGPQPQSNINSLIILITLVVIALFVAGFFAGTKIAYVNIENDGITPNIYSDGEFDSLSNNSELYLNIWNTVEKEYLTDKVDEEQLMYGSIRGMVDALDDNYSKFLDPAENEMQLNDNAGKYEGIGVYLEYNTTLGYTYIESVIDGFPAQEAGVMSGDLVLEVDGEFMDGKRPSYVASKILGEDGTEVKIKFYSQTEENAFEKVIIRKKI